MNKKSQVKLGVLLALFVLVLVVSALALNLTENSSEIINPIENISNNNFTEVINETIPLEENSTTNETIVIPENVTIPEEIVNDTLPLVEEVVNDSEESKNIALIERVIKVLDAISSSSFSFVSPTPANGSRTSNISVIINATISISDLTTLNYTWNGTNYSLYDSSLLLRYNYFGIILIMFLL